MKIFSKTIIVSLVFIFTVALIIRNSFALVPLISQDALKDKISEIKIDTWVVKCNSVKSLADKKLTKFEENKNKHFKIYSELTLRFSEKIDKWDELGLDTTKLKADLKVAEEKIAKFEEDYADYRAKLEAIKILDCSDTLSDYAKAIKDARDTLKSVREDVVDIKTYYWTQIRTDILDLKKQIISNSEE
jgi:CRISPR/Cas system CMR-associated protein Cmr5 small subunit